MSPVRAVLFFSAVALASAVELTEDTWEGATAGKTTFVKFYAPWCGHCKKLAPEWAKLEHNEVVIAEVDCTQNKKLCADVGVRGYPTLKHGDPSDLQDYKGERTYDALNEFLQTLGPPCDIITHKHCSDKQVKRLGEYKKFSDSELNQLLEDEASTRNNIETLFKESVEKLQNQYKRVLAEKEGSLGELAEYETGIIKLLLSARKEKRDLGQEVIETPPEMDEEMHPEMHAEMHPEMHPEMHAEMHPEMDEETRKMMLEDLPDDIKTILREELRKELREELREEKRRVPKGRRVAKGRHVPDEL